MNEYSESERVINLKDMLFRTAQKWRSIIVFALVIALIATLWQAASGLLAMLDDEKTAAAKEKYGVAVADFEATGERLRTRIDNLRSQATNQNEYNEKSELMKIDPMNKWVGNFQIYVDSKYQIDPSLSYQNTDLTNRLLSAYSNYLRSGGFYNEILNEIDTVDEIRFLTEIYSVTADPGSATITVNVLGKTEADIQRLIGFVKLKIAERYDTIREAIGDHDYDFMTESVYSTIDLDLDARQKENLLAIMEYSNEIGETTQELTAWEKEAPPKMDFGAWYTVKEAIKSLIIGGVIGLIIAICWFAVRYAASGAIKTEGDWKAFGVPVLGTLEIESDKRRFRSVDRLIDRIFGRRNSVTLDQSCAITAQNLGAMLQQYELQEGVFAGQVDFAQATDIVQKMDAAAQNIKFSYAGDILTDPGAAKKLDQSGKIILLAKNQTTSLKDINQMLTLLKAWGKTVLGVVVLDQ